MKILCTTRGFEFGTFHDSYDNECSIQQSSATDCESAPGAFALWLGMDGTAHSRMHLDREQVAELVAHMTAWLETGSLRIGADDGEDGR